MRRIRMVDIIALFILVVAGVKLTFGIEQIADIGLFDESGYLYAGASFLQHGLFPATWSPFYAIWYFFLSFFENNRVALYYLNAKIMTILPVVLIYILLRSYKSSLPVAIISAWMFLISLSNLTVWPKPAHFALIIVLAFFIITGVPRKYINKVPMMAIGALLSSYARPELFVSYVLFVLWYMSILVMHWKEVHIRKELFPIATLIVVSILMMSVFGNPVWGGPGNRSYEAFSQHFALNWVQWTDSDLNPWNDADIIMKMNFGSANGIYSAFTNNSGAVAKHILYNIVNYVKYIVFVFFLHFNIILPGYNITINRFEGFIWGLFVSVSGILIIRREFKSIFVSIQKYGFVLVSCILFSVPGLISSIVIYPEYHYLIIQSVLVSIILVVTIINNAGFIKRIEVLSLSVPVALIFVLVATPYISVNWYRPNQGELKNTGLENIRTIEYINSLSIHQNINMLDADGGYYIYVGDNYNRIAQSAKDIGFGAFLLREKIDAIVISDTLRNDIRYRSDHEWISFISGGYRSFGYKAMSVPGTNREIVIRDAIVDLKGNQ